MTYATCRSCGDSFEREPGEGWKKLCVACWRERQPQRDAQDINAYIVRGLRKHIGTLIARCAPFDGEEPCEKGDEAYDWLGQVDEIFRKESGR